MFWIGLIVGVIIGIVVAFLVSKFVMAAVFGSWEKYSEGFRLLLDANFDRKSYVQAFTDTKILGTVVFEEE